MGKQDLDTKFLLRTVTERNHLGDLGVGERIVLKLT